MFSLSRESEQDLAHGILEVVERYLKRVIDSNHD